MPTTPKADCTVSSSTLYLAFDLGQVHWNVVCSTGFGQQAREVRITAGAIGQLTTEIAFAKRRFGLPSDAPVVACYEAGRDGFWLHRCLEAHQVRCLVIDSSSIEVNRRQRRKKTDRIDAGKLLRLLMRFSLGEEKVFSVVNVPSPQEEDQRHLHRQLKTLSADETRITNRIHGVLASLGVDLLLTKNFEKRLSEARQWNGEQIPEGVRRRVLSDFAVLRAVQRQILELRRVQKAEVRNGSSPAVKQIRKLLSLRAVGIRTASTYANELFAWRKFKSRREVGGLAGLCPTPYSSGQTQHEHGISKAGNRWVRALAIELAWSWIRFQPDSALTLWYQQRARGASSRLRRITIVALARKLLVALWKFLETGEPPKGAILLDWKAKLRGRYVVITP
jgi:transposase